MRILSIEVRLLDLPLTEPFAASHGTTTSRAVSVVKLTTDTATGWGECSALPAATYTAESAAGSYRALVEQMAPPLLGLDVPAPFGGGSSDTETELGRRLAAHPSLPMARSALEMAVIDAILSTTGVSLASWLATGRTEGGGGPRPNTVTAGVSVGLATVQETVARCVALSDEGYRRLKVKIEPDHDVGLVTAIRAALPAVELQVDANGAYRTEIGRDRAENRTTDRHLIDHLLSVVDAGADVIEQPFSVDDPGAAATLIGRLNALGLSVPVVADEAVEGTKDAESLLAAKAMTGLSIKPGRVGGLAAAARLHDLCRSAGIGATAGGMLETGLGRHALVALATLPGFTITGDLSPAGRWLAADPWPALTMADGMLTVPTGPGIAPEPDLDLLADHTVAVAVLNR